MKEKIVISTKALTKDPDVSQSDERPQDDGESIIEVNRSGVAEVYEKHEREVDRKSGAMPSGPELPYDVERAHTSTSKR